jgi:acetolactate synthase regulatory subunit
MSSWDVARLTARLGDHNIKINTEVRHIEKKVKRVVRHRGFDSRTLVGTSYIFRKIYNQF